VASMSPVSEGSERSRCKSEVSVVVRNNTGPSSRTSKSRRQPTTVPAHLYMLDELGELHCVAVVPGATYVLRMEKPDLFNQLVLDYTTHPTAETLMPLRVA